MVAIPVCDHMEGRTEAVFCWPCFYSENLGKRIAWCRTSARLMWEGIWS